MQLLLSGKRSTNEATEQSQLQSVFINPSFISQTCNEGSRKTDDMSDGARYVLFMLIFRRLAKLCSSPLRY